MTTTLTLTLLILLSAFVLTLVAAIGRAPLWIPLLLVIILLLIQSLPVR